MPEQSNAGEPLQRNEWGFFPEMPKEEVSALPLIQFEGEIIVINSLRELDRHIDYLFASRLLGFDTETKPAFKKGTRNKVALLQLADDKKAFLFRLNLFGLPPELASIMISNHIKKIGVAVRDDIAALHKLRPFHATNFLELQTHVREFGIQAMGLRNISAIVLGHKISKAQQVTNWEAERLTDSQCIYAATDAWICHRLYTTLLNHNKPAI
jgi:ribonuclease D